VTPEAAGPRRISPWWLLPPALLFALNMATVLATDQATTENGVYSGGYLAAAALTAVILGGYALAAARFSHVDPRASLAVVPPPAGWWRPAGVAFAAILIVNLALDPVLHGDKAQGITPDRPPHGSEWVILAISLVVLSVVVPAAEELLFRGLAFATLGRYAVVGSAALFAFAHALPELLPVVFLSGLALGALRRRTGSVIPGMAAHGLLNLTGILVAIATS